MKKSHKLFPGIILSLISIFLMTCFINCSNFDEKTAIDSEEVFPVPRIDFNPKSYQCIYSSNPLIIDGEITDAEWSRADWTDSFADIEGPSKPAPYYDTKAKMLWDSSHFYIAAKLEEPHIWANIEERDAVIYHENDFEVFIDPDGDTHEYYELEMNALNTVWDLLLIKPYRDGGPAINAWDIAGLKSAVSIQGTLNNPTDVDKYWTLEIAIPWHILEECAHKPSPPEPGDYWRVNFSRVEWDLEVADGKYVKKTDENGNSLPEHNWTWSPQGIIRMHYPEMWGFVQFEGSGLNKTDFAIPEVELAKWNLRQVYYHQKNLYENTGAFSKDRSFLNSSGFNFKDLVKFESNSLQWSASITLPEGGQTVRIYDDGRTEVILDDDE